MAPQENSVKCLKRSNLGHLSSVALRAGLLAIVINTTLLSLADQFGLITARGGLLKLLMKCVLPLMVTLGDGTFASGLATVTKTYGFQTAFHIVVGVVMAVVTVCTFPNAISKHPWRVGIVSAAVVWLMNAAIILPLLGEGFAGSLNLTTAGILYFAAAHTMFFLVLALLANRWLAT